MQYFIDYIGGHPVWGKPTTAILTVNKEFETVYLRTNPGTGLKPISIHKDDILSVDFEKNSTRSAGKAVAGAIIGGVLTGGVGLLIGGAIGAKKKNQSELYITIRYNEKEFVVCFKTGKHTDFIYAEINGLFA